MRIVNKYGESISAYLDSALVYQGMGDNVDGDPYGIFALDNACSLNIIGLEAYIRPGMFYMYGRQIDFDGSTLIDDFSNYILNDVNYVVVYVQIDLSNVMDQQANLVVDCSGSAYPALDDGYAQNLYESNYGICRAPLWRFKYTPADDSPFSDRTRIAPILKFETRACVEEIRTTDTLESKSAFGDIFDDRGYAYLADNSDALAAYDEYYVTDGKDGEDVWGYSLADETESIGGVAIGEDLSAGSSTLVTSNRMSSSYLTMTKIQSHTAGTEYGYPIGTADEANLVLAKLGFASGGIAFALTTVCQTQSGGIVSTETQTCSPTNALPEWYMDALSAKTLWLCTSYTTSSGTSGHHDFALDLYWTDEEPDEYEETGTVTYNGTEQALMRVKLRKTGTKWYLFVTRYGSKTYFPISSTGSGNYYTYTLSAVFADDDKGLVVDCLYGGDAAI